MKAKEVPEKIYRTTLYLDNNKGETKWKGQPVVGAENIEYTRTDAFIEKAVEWLKEQDEIIGVSFQEDFLERFKNYMKGE